MIHRANLHQWFGRICHPITICDIIILDAMLWWRAWHTDASINRQTNVGSLATLFRLGTPVSDISTYPNITVVVSPISLNFHLTGFCWYICHVFPNASCLWVLHVVAAASLFVLTRDITTCVNVAKFSKFLMKTILAFVDIISNAAMLYYDYILTFKREIEFFWKRPKRSLPFILFIATRYIMVIGSIPVILYNFSYEVCCACLIRRQAVCC